MKKKYLKLLMLPMLCTALSACDTIDVSINSVNVETNSTENNLVESSSEGELTSNLSEEITSVVEEKTETQKAVSNVLNAYRDDDIIGKMFEASNALDSSLAMNLNAIVEDTKQEHSKAEIEMELNSTNNVNTYVDNIEEEALVKIYSEAKTAGKINLAADIGIEDPDSGEITSYVPSHMITDMDLNAQSEVSDKTFVKVQGKVPAIVMVADSEEYVESVEEIAARSNTDFKGYQDLGYEGWKNTLDTLISLAMSMKDGDGGSGSVSEPSTEIVEEGAFDLNDEKTYSSIYEFLTDEESNALLTRTVTESAEGYTFEFSLNLGALDILSLLSGETIGAQLSEFLGLEGKDAIDYATIKRNNGNSNKMDLEIKLGTNFLMKNLSVDLNLDDIDIEVREYEEVDENTTTETPVVIEDYIVNLDKFNVLFNADFTYGEEVLELGLSEEDKADILANGKNLSELYSEGLEEIL